MKYCAEPNCGVLVKKGRCPKHARQVDQGTRGTAQQRGYTYQWNLYSKNRLRQFPLCVMCEQQGLTTPATCTDHIIPLCQGGDMWDPTNHQSLCTRCNTIKGDRIMEVKTYTDVDFSVRPGKNTQLSQQLPSDGSAPGVMPTYTNPIGTTTPQQSVPALAGPGDIPDSH